MLSSFSWLDSINDSPSLPKEFQCLSGLGLESGGFAYHSTYALRTTIPSVASFNSKRPYITLYN